MRLRWIGGDDPLYAAELELRYEVLRRPLGMTRAQIVSPSERESLHLVALEQGRVVGCVLLLPPKGGGAARLRQMAVCEPHRARGVGRALVRELERRALDLGARRIVLHARAPAVGFYERLGYEAGGPAFLEVGIPHREMARPLRRADLRRGGL